MDAKVTTGQEPADDRRARRNALILSVGQALYGTSAVTVVALGGLVGQALAVDKSLATLPISTFVLGTATATIPASFVMRAIGRRGGFMIGAGFGSVSAALAAYAIFTQVFWLFCLATSLNGVYQAFAQYYRFAAADTASAEFRPKAISWVLAGGLVAAVAGPQLVIFTKAMFEPVLFAGSFVGTAVVAIVAMAILSFVDIPLQPRHGEGGQQPRPLSVILAQPKLIVAILCGMVSYAVMNFVMTAAPLAMVACNHSVDQAALAIQWHVLAMFAPSFVTGNLIQRFGRERVALAGLALLFGSGGVALSGIAIWQFDLALILLGVGWNLGFVAATTMVTDCHRPEERGKVQALNEFMVFGAVAVASFASGKVLHDLGWEAVGWTVFPLVGVAAILVLTVLLARRARIAAV